MPVQVEERYTQMFAQLRFASEMRFKILAGWGAVYVALAASFVWIQSSTMKPLSWVVPVLALVATILFWLADYRNRPALGAAKEVGAAVEADPASEIPEGQRYFSRVERGVPLGIIVNAFAVCMLVLFVAATIYLVCTNELFK